MQEPISKRAEQFIVRLPDGMRDRIRRAAEANNRSMNAQIVSTLAEAYPEKIDINTDRALTSVALVLNLLAETGDEAAIQQGLKHAQRALDELGITDRKFWYVNFHGDFIVMFTSKDEASREWTDAEIARHNVRKFGDRMNKRVG